MRSARHSRRSADKSVSVLLDDFEPHALERMSEVEEAPPRASVANFAGATQGVAGAAQGQGRLGASWNSGRIRHDRNDVLSIANSPVPIPLLNRMLSSAYRWHPLLVFLALLVLFAGLGLVLALLLVITSCADGQGFGETFVLSIGQFISLGEEAPPRASEAPGCVLLTLSASICALMLQASMFAFFVSRILNPCIELCVPSKLCVLDRNGEFFLSTKIGHPQGHTISNAQTTLLWVEPVKTAEGESFNRIRELPFVNQPPALLYPTTYIHALEGSFLEPYAADLSAAPGRLVLIIEGFDECLRTPIFERYIFQFTDVEFGRFADLAASRVGDKNRPTEAKRPRVDLTNMDTVVGDPEVARRARERFSEPASRTSTSRPQCVAESAPATPTAA